MRDGNKTKRDGNKKHGTASPSPTITHWYCCRGWVSHPEVYEYGDRSNRRFALRYTVIIVTLLCWLVSAYRG